MNNSIKKLSLSFIFLNIFMFQSLMADMIFYYSAAILPSIVAKPSDPNVNTTFTGSLDVDQSNYYRFRAISTGKAFFAWEKYTMEVSLSEGADSICSDSDGYMVCDIKKTIAT